LFVTNIIAFTILLSLNLWIFCLHFFKTNVHKKFKNARKNAHKKSSLLNTQKLPKNAHKKCKKHTKNAKNDVSVLINTLPGWRGSDVVLVRSFHHIGSPRCYRDLLESVRGLMPDTIHAYSDTGQERRAGGARCKDSNPGAQTVRSKWVGE
jgi:hypothetical protein